MSTPGTASWAAALPRLLVLAVVAFFGFRWGLGLGWVGAAAADVVAFALAAALLGVGAVDEQDGSPNQVVSADSGGCVSPRSRANNSRVLQLSLARRRF
jgi:hypothetical protein